MYFEGLRKTKRTHYRMCLRWERNYAAPKYRSTQLPLEHPGGFASLGLVTSVCLFSVCAADLGQMYRTAVATLRFTTRRSMDTSKSSQWTQVSPQTICAYRQNSITCFLVVSRCLKISTTLSHPRPSNPNFHYCHRKCFVVKLN